MAILRVEAGYGHLLMTCEGAWVQSGSDGDANMNMLAGDTEGDGSSFSVFPPTSGANISWSVSGKKKDPYIQPKPACGTGDGCLAFSDAPLEPKIFKDFRLSQK